MACWGLKNKKKNKKIKNQLLIINGKLSYLLGDDKHN